MTVIVNELEVISDPVETQPGGEAESEAASTSPAEKGITPLDITGVWRHELERLCRVRAD